MANVATDRVCAEFVGRGRCVNSAGAHQIEIRHLSHQQRDEIYDQRVLADVATNDLTGGSAVVEFHVETSSAQMVGEYMEPSAEVYSFDVRHFQFVSTSISNDQGFFELDFVAPTDPADPDKTFQRLEVTPFAVTAGHLHQFVQADNNSLPQFRSYHVVQHTSLFTVPPLVDNSSYAITGRVVLGARSDATQVQPLVDSVDCPVIGAQVCALDRVTGEEIGACVTTNQHGNYTLTVVIGSNVEVAVRMPERQFVAQYPAELDNLLLEVDEDVHGIDFLETTTMEVAIEYGGGACLTHIGAAEFFVYAANHNPSCDVRARVRVGHDGEPVARVLLPAQNYVTQLKDDSVDLTGVREPKFAARDVPNYFEEKTRVRPQGEQVGLNRTLVFNSTLQLNGTLEVVRYEFHVIPTLELRVTANGKRLRRQDCFEQGLIVAQTGTRLNFKVLLEEQYTDEFCQDVSGLVLVEESLTGDSSANGEYKIDVTFNGATAVSSVVEVDVGVGPPETVAPFERVFRATYQGFIPPNGGDGWDFVSRRKDQGRVHAVAIVEGERVIADGFSLKVPDFVPFLILRRPPGASSSATYKVSHSAKLQAQVTRTNKIGIETSVEVGPKVDIETRTCAGNPLGGPHICTKSSDTDIKGFAKVEVGATFPFISRTGAKTLEFAVALETEISTTGYAGMAGAAGDLFFSPTVSIKFAVFAVISVDDGVCFGRRDEYEKWTLVPGDAEEDQLSGDLSPAERQARARLLARFSGGHSSVPDNLDPEGAETEFNRKLALWNNVKNAYREEDSVWNSQTLHSVYDVLEIRIPQLQERKANAERDRDCLSNFDPATCPPLDVLKKGGGVDEFDFRAQVAQAGIEGWQNTLKIYADLNTAALKYPLDPQKLFSSKQVGEGALRNKLQRDVRELRVKYAELFARMLAPTKVEQLEQSNAIWREAGLTTGERVVLTALFLAVTPSQRGMGISKDLAFVDRNSLQEVISLASFIGTEVIPTVGLNIFGLSTVGDYLQKIDTTRDRRNMVSFSGGGAKFAYSTSSTDTQAKSDTDLFAFELKIVPKFDTVIKIFGTGLGLKIAAAVPTSLSIDKETSGENEAAEDIAFELADDTVGDQFDVELYRDPVYNTIVYRTISGRSMCTFYLFIFLFCLLTIVASFVFQARMRWGRRRARSSSCSLTAGYGSAR